MIDLYVAPGVGHYADDRTEGAERRRRHSTAALGGNGHHPENRVQAGRGEWAAPVYARRRRREPRLYQAPGGAANPIIVTLLAGLAAEVVSPWAVIWLSDALVFDIPPWSLWLVFGVPAVLTLFAVLIQWVLRTWSRQAARAAVPARQG
jgi:hypothetical protein